MWLFVPVWIRGNAEYFASKLGWRKSAILVNYYSDLFSEYVVFWMDLGQKLTSVLLSL